MVTSRHRLTQTDHSCSTCEKKKIKQTNLSGCWLHIIYWLSNYGMTNNEHGTVVSCITVDILPFVLHNAHCVYTYIIMYSCWHIKSSTSPYNNTTLLPLIVLGTNKQAGVGGNPRKQKSYSFIQVRAK